MRGNRHDDFIILRVDTRLLRQHFRFRLLRM